MYVNNSSWPPEPSPEEAREYTRRHEEKFSYLYSEFDGDKDMSTADIASKIIGCLPDGTLIGGSFDGLTEEQRAHQEEAFEAEMEEWKKSEAKWLHEHNIEQPINDLPKTRPNIIRGEE